MYIYIHVDIHKIVILVIVAAGLEFIKESTMTFNKSLFSCIIMIMRKVWMSQSHRNITS